VAIRTFHFTNHHLLAEMAASYKFHVTPKYGKRSVGLTRLISHRHVTADRRDRNINKIE
jgi:glucan phosphorylase